MPQTHEHLRVLRALGVGEGVVAITKADAADPQPLRGQLAQLVPGAEVVACSARTGAGLPDLHAALEGLASRAPSRAELPGPPRLHIDRAFTVTGRGTVVTGTLWSGAIGAGDELDLLPAGRRVRVRGVQVHDVPEQRARAGQRVAVNLTGVKHREVARGDVLGLAGTLRATRVLDCALELHDARHGERAQVHHGTRAVPARLAALGDGLWQLRLESALLVVAGDRVVVRRVAPPDTLGGGVVLDALARRHGRRPELLRRLYEIRAGGPGVAPIGANGPGATPEPASPAGDRARERARGRPEGTPPGTGGAEERVDERAVDAVQTRLTEAGLALLSEAQLEADAAALQALRRRGRAVRVAGRLYADADVLARARAEVIELIGREGPVRLARVRDALKTSRKSAQAILEHMDGARLTRRLPDDRRALGPRSRRPR